MAPHPAPGACPAGGERGLTDGEKALVASVFGGALDPDPVRIKRRKWFPFQPANTLMAPTGHIHFPARTRLYCDDFAHASLWLKGLFLHEMTHVWQSQQRGKYWLVMMRHPFCRYGYAVMPGRRLTQYGIEQQAEIVRHAFLLRHGFPLIGAPPREQLETILPFTPQ
ncbi:vgr related protein [Croceicoccus sp. YJ47]|uniref:vgr related protein n=1 Tax=Croceicoccus sp. YJ47 TaxID=2798724 RepID=UPI001921CA40|nr:vgr related protein [Croceicoccus sp. YJ47]QQN74191.1 vgr related protein [Croceicoccus sp. YJ47]